MPLFTPGCREPVHPGVKGGDMGVFTGLCACPLLKKRWLLWNEEPYSANLIPIVFVFTFVCLIVLYAFFKSKRRQYAVFQSYDKNAMFQE